MVLLRRRRISRHRHPKAILKLILALRSVENGIEAWTCVSHTASARIVQELRDKPTLTVVHLHEPSRGESGCYSWHDRILNLNLQQSGLFTTRLRCSY
jgi:hypothetical protein